MLIETVSISSFSPGDLKMLKSLFAHTLLLVVAASFTSTAMGLPYDQNIYLFHEGSNNPQLSSPPWTLDPGSNPLVVSSGPGTEVIGATSYDYWHTTDNGTGFGDYLRYTSAVQPAQFLDAWTLRARLRSVGTTSIDQIFFLQDGSERWGVYIQDDRILNIASNSLIALADMTSTYRELEMLYTPFTPGFTNSADLLEIYLDQNLIGSYTRNNAFSWGGSPIIMFGGNSSPGTGSIHWNRIEFVEGATLGFAQLQVEITPIPEPGTLGLLGLGIFLGINRQRRRQTRAA